MAMGSGGAFLVASLLAGQLAQGPLPKPEPPVGVDVNVQTVSWNSTGTALLYTKKERAGTAVGVYATGMPEGKVLLHVGPEDQMETQWFDAAPFVVVIVYTKVPTSDGDRHHAEVHLLDARALKDRVLFSRAFEAKSGIEVDVDPSPGLVHAIFRVKDGEQKRHFVLTTSLAPLVASADLDQAVREGFQGPSWSIDGTAAYSKGYENADDAGKPFYDPATGLLQPRLRLEMDRRARVLGDLPLLGRFFIGRAPSPPVGAPVLEVMPSNGALRQVRFRGEWSEEEPDLPPLGSAASATPVKLGVSQGEANSLWLTHGEEAPTKGVLIAPHGGQVWLSPRNRAVAYLVDGALFVRALGK